MGFISRTLQDYGQFSSIHGVGYIFGKGRFSALEKLFWILLVITGTFFGVLMTWTIFVEWNEQKVQIILDNEHTSGNQVPFPTVTICDEVIVFILYK